MYFLSYRYVKGTWRCIYECVSSLSVGYRIPTHVCLHICMIVCVCVRRSQWPASVSFVRLSTGRFSDCLTALSVTVLITLYTPKSLPRLALYLKAIMKPWLANVYTVIRTHQTMVKSNSQITPVSLIYPAQSSRWMGCTAQQCNQAIEMHVKMIFF